MRSFLVAIQFLTIFPLGSDLNFEQENSKAVVASFPSVGFVLALSGWGALLFIRFLRTILSANTNGNPIVEAVLLVIFVSILSGLLHLDGLADTCDGLGSRTGRERTLEIMRDSRIGSFGGCGLVFVLLSKVGFLAALPLPLLFWGFVWSLTAGRWGMSMACAQGNYARENASGLGVFFITGTNFKNTIMQFPGIALLALVSCQVLPWQTILLAIFFTVFVAFTLTRYFTLKFGGLTGDTLGAVNELCELAVLFAFYLST